MDMDILNGSSSQRSVPSPAVETETSPAVDAIVHISISPDGLQAVLSMEPPQNGGAAPTLEALHTALNTQKISFQVNEQLLQVLADNPTYNRDLLIANGIPPVHGIDGTVSFQIKTQKTVLTPKVREDGTVDYHDLGLVENVSKGQVLCVLTPPTEGTPGMTVKGAPIPQKRGQPVPSLQGKNTVLSEDGTAILSALDGQADYDGRKINVNETFMVKENVDNSTGDIRVTGNLTVKGSVLPGFVLEAGGNIEIRGSVENATIRAGGSIHLYSGIVGGELTCEGDLQCRFIENSNVTVKGDIQAEYLINSSVRCGKNIRIVGKIAKIIGGSCMAGQNIEAHTIGTESNVKTKLTIGTDPAVFVRQQELLAQVSEASQRLEKLTPLLRILNQLEAAGRLTPDKKLALENVRFSFDSDTKFLEDADVELEEIAQTVRLKGFGRVICPGFVHPGTLVEIGGAALAVKDTLKNVSLYYGDGLICTAPAR